MPHHRIAANTAIGYLGFLVTAVLAIISSRWIFAALGQVDFGLFSLVGSLILFVTFLNSLLAGSASRSFAVSIGEGDAAAVSQWFKASVAIHAGLALTLVLLGWPIGEYVLVKYLSLPPERVRACVSVFRLSMISAFFSMLSVPFVAMFAAKQNLGELAAWGILQAVLISALAWSLLHSHADLLVLYAAGMAAIVTLTQVSQIARAFFLFEECRAAFRLPVDTQKCGFLVRFASWTLFGGLAVLLREHGSALLLNVHFGAPANAAYAVATQVSTQTNQLSSTIVSSFAPAIATSEGARDRSSMLSLAHGASKFGTLLILSFAVPLIIEMDVILRAWLASPPEHAAVLCRLVLIALVIDRSSTGYMLAVNAYGKIGAYQLTVGGVQLLALPIAWLLFIFGWPPTSVGIAFVITMAAASLGRALWGRKLFNVPVATWGREVLIPCTLFGACVGAAALLPALFLPESLLRAALTGSLAFCAAIAACWSVVFTSRDRHVVLEAVRKRILRKASRSGS